jgi:hypothetical protein
LVTTDIQDQTPWSKQDIKSLKQMAGNERLANIAKALGSTPGATRQRATQNSISLRMKAKNGGSGKQLATSKAKYMVRGLAQARCPGADGFLLLPRCEFQTALPMQDE